MKNQTARNNRTLKSASLLLVGLLSLPATSQSSIYAQGNRGTLTRASSAVNFDRPKIETKAQGPKTETRAPHTVKGNSISTSSNLGSTPFGLIAGEATTTSTPASSSPKTGSTTKTAYTYDVGIIPGANGCPSGSELLSIYLDDEDDNANSSSGWVGATVQDLNTEFKICRVDGTQFPVILHAPYAVLQLGTACPNGATIFTRKFDNENFKNNDHSSGGISPNYVNKTQSNAQLSFCMFSGEPFPGQMFGNGNTQFPALGVEYGVFAANDFPGILDSGSIHIDDEDEGNTNSYGGAYGAFLSEASRIVSGGLNTDINMVKIAAGAPVYGSLHSVSLNTASVVGGSSCNDIVITVYLDGPARPEGQEVYLSSSNQSKAGIFDPGHFTIPGGQSSGSASCFMGTEKVKETKDVIITVSVNGQPGYVHLNVTRK